MRDYLKQAFEEMATAMEAAGLTAWLQHGEREWRFDANASGMAFYDAVTTADFLADEGRALYTFLTPNDDPNVNAGVDADWLAERLRSWTQEVTDYVNGLHAGAKWELLWPLDINLPETRQLNFHVNLPPAWKVKAGSGFDAFLCEGFQFGRIFRDLDGTQRVAAYPFTELSWDRADCGYLMGLLDAGWPWERDFLLGRRTRVPVVKAWAIDHLCFYGRRLRLLRERRRAELRRAA